MSRLQHDQFVDDDEDECCPLCVEEFDLSDRNFRPCPCGYQICQFCFNNIKTTMNGLCPACRRPYDDATIEWRTISPEEMARHKQQIAQKAKKNAQMRQKEAQKAEADTLSRKHLAGLRVVQKNLVYVTGLTPTIREDRLLDTLRGDDYFGQYGKIIKIVVSKARENAQHQQSVGVYVTFARKEDAAACIKAVDASQNGDRTLRAQYGTTKYCSAYLRGEHCNNRSCMFLHEPGEDNDSFTRQDLSMMNSIQTQQPAQSSTSRAAPPAHHGPPVAAAAPMNRQDSNDAPSPTQDAPGLPATASWGSKAALERRASRSTIASNPSPMVTNAVPAQVSKPTKTEEPAKKKSKEKEREKEKEKEKERDTSMQTSKSATPQPATTPLPAVRPVKKLDHAFKGYLKPIFAYEFKFKFSIAGLSEDDLKAIMEFPLLIDPQGGAKRRAAREREAEMAFQREAESDSKAPVQEAPTEREENEATVGGSLQLGGEPEDGHEQNPSHPNQHTIAPPGQQAFGGSLFGQNVSLAEGFSSLGLSNRGLTQQEQQQLLLSNFKSGTQSSGVLSGMQNTPTQQHGLSGNSQGHTRHTSRFSFANDSASASANVQPVANQKLMSQQNSMMPKNASQFNQHSQHQPMGGQFFTNVQGPPPGLKPTGTPPVSGTGMFGQGHGFATGGLGYGTNAAGRNNNDAMYQDLLRGRNMDGGARGVDAGKQDGPISSDEQALFNVDALVNDQDHDQEPARKLRTTPLNALFLNQAQRAIPVVPPGFAGPAVPRGGVEKPAPRANPRATSAIIPTPALPAVPSIPTPALPQTPASLVPSVSASATTPTKATKGKQKSEDIEPATPKAHLTSGVPPKTPTRTASKTVVAKPRTPGESVTAKLRTPGESAAVKPRTPGEVSTKPKESVVEKNKITKEELKPTTEINPADLSKPKTANKKKVSVDTSPKKSLQKISHSAAIPSSSTKRQPPGKLDIAAATTNIENDEPTPASPANGNSQAKNARPLPSSSVPSSPAAVATGSPIKRSVAPRTLRVIQTPKTEAPPSVPATSASAQPQLPTVDKLRSRQASIASVNPPGTPISDLISDTASITSTSFSRANSPPPIGGKVGTAPVRKKTKSQAKKDRQERKRHIEEEQTTVEDNKSDVEVMQAPIVGRKKKSKKLASVPKPLAAAFKSQPASPKPATVEEEQLSDAPATDSRSHPSAKTSAAGTPEPEQEPDDAEESKHKREQTAQSIMADLQQAGELLATALEFFKPLSSSLTHSSRHVSALNTSTPLDLKIHFSEADIDALTKKKPVRLSGHSGQPDSRTLITPGGKFFWGLTQELEEKALELEKRIEEVKGYARFHPRKHTSFAPTQHNHTHSQHQDVLPAIATALKEAGKKLNTTSQKMPKIDPSSGLLGSNQTPEASASYTQPPPPSQQQTPSDAGTYLNQFVLPKTDNPPPNQPRPEMAAVGGPPGAGTAHLSVNVNRFAKAAKAVVEGGAVGSTEIDGMGMMASDLLGGVFVQGLEALVGAGLGFQSAHDFDGGRGGVDVQGLMSALESTAGMGGYGAGGRRGRGSVLSMEEAEMAMLAARKEHDVLEKKLAALMKKNKKAALGRA